MDFQEIVELVSRVLDGAGVLAIVLGVLLATVAAGSGLAKRAPGIFENYRRALGRSILLGLELLVAADIIRTVAVKPTFEGVGVLAVIVAIRTFLSWALELEITGRWPWQKAPASQPAHVEVRAR